MHRTAKYLYIIGGCALSAEREPISQIERIHVEQTPSRIEIISENCGQLLFARRSPACFLKRDEEILVVGGCFGPNEHSDSIEILGLDGGEVSSRLLKERMKIGTSCAGFDPETSSPFKPIFGGFVAHSCLDDIQVFDSTPTKLNCRKIDKCGKNCPKIKNSTILDVGNWEFLMFGGWEDEQRTSKAIRKIKFNEDFTDFTIEFAGFLPYPVEGHSNVRFGLKVLLIGGFDGFSVIDSIISYDLETRQSEVLDVKLSEKRENHVSAVLSGEFLVIAGGWNSRNSLDDVEVFRISEEDGTINLERMEVNGKLKTARNRPAGVPV